MVYQHCNDTINGQQPVSGPDLTWRRWLGTGWRLFKSDAGELLTLLTTWQKRAAMRQYILTLDHRMLRDINVSRADILAEAQKPFWRK